MGPPSPTGRTSVGFCGYTTVKNTVKSVCRPYMLEYSRSPRWPDQDLATLEIFASRLSYTTHPARGLLGNGVGLSNADGPPPSAGAAGLAHAQPPPCDLRDGEDDARRHRAPAPAVQAGTDAAGRESRGTEAAARPEPPSGEDGCAVSRMAHRNQASVASSAEICYGPNGP